MDVDEQATTIGSARGSRDEGEVAKGKGPDIGERVTGTEKGIGRKEVEFIWIWIDGGLARKLSRGEN